MSAEIRGVAPTGLKLYAHLMNAAGQRWNGSAFETYVSGHYSTYVIPLTEQGSSGAYFANFPTAITAADDYQYIVYLQTGGSPTEGTDRVIVPGHIIWGGSAIVPSTVTISPATVRANIEGYGINTSVLSDSWITNRINNKVIPWVNNYIRSDLLNVKTKTKLYSGNGTEVLLLDEINILSLIAVNLVSYINLPVFLSVSSMLLDGPRGILKIKVVGVSSASSVAFFPKGDKNIQVQYTYGYGGTIPADITQAIIDLACVEAFRLLADRTGGGNLTTQGFSRDWGPKGKYSNIRKSLSDSAIATLMPYTSRSIGS